MLSIRLRTQNGASEPIKKIKKKFSLNSPSQMGFDGVKKQDRKSHAWAPLRAVEGMYNSVNLLECKNALVQHFQ